VERSIFLSAVESALSISSSKESQRVGSEFAKQACLEWLSRWPGDFRVRAHLVDAYCLGGEFDAAVPQLQQVIEADPESTRPYQTLSALLRRIGQTAAVPEGCLFGLDAGSGAQTALPDWADPLQVALHLMRSGRWEEARLSAETVLRTAPDQPLPAVVHLQALSHLAEYPVVLSAGKEYRKSWPSCAAILLLMAQSSIASGRNADGVELLHAASVADPAGEVADRYLGSLNPYRSLWPQHLQLDLSIGLPAEVASAAGWNQLTSPPAPPAEPNLPEDIPVLRFPDYDSQNPDQSPMVASSTIAPIPGEVFTGPSDASKNAKPVDTPVKESSIAENRENSSAPESDLEDLRRQLNQVAIRLRMKKSTAEKDVRRPAYILLTSRRLLKSIYGPDLQSEIENCLQDILRAKRSARGWSAYLVDADNRESLQPFGLDPVDASNAWQVKTLLTNLDGTLAKKGEMIGALLIVGGHEVIPFHLLPNPTDDGDPDVPSDNPYASRDENYFVPEWPVGRIPTPSDTHATFLLGVLRRIADESAPIRVTLLQNLLSIIRNFFPAPASRFRTGSGCTAAVWQKASAEVFRLIGPSNGLLVCPPVNSGNLPSDLLSGPKYSYFNLHGMENGPQWLGQRNVKGKSSEDVEFPIALLPSQVAGARKTSDVVFTEACYGANILRKGVGDSISLEFLASGTRTLVGSTKICYGAASTPLIAADLLARLFLQNCLAGIPIGEALRQAKLSSASEMNRRQSYLDPEDQKTLISFLLLGDPLHVSVTATGKRVDPEIIRWRKSAPAIQTLQAKGDLLENGSVPSENVQTSLKKAMHQYLPGMSDSRLRYLHPRPETPAETAGSRGKKGRGVPRSPAWVVALDRKYEAHGQSLTQYAKISMDSSGRVIKVTVSH
jgi:hypothetical protein